MKKLKALQQNNDGMTMVEVLMGFVILSIILGAVVTLISFSSKMYFNSVDLRKSQTQLYSDAYKSGTNGNKVPVTTTDSGYVVVEDDSTTTPVKLSTDEVVGYKNMQLYKVNQGEIEAYVFVSTVTPEATP